MSMFPKPPSPGDKPDHEPTEMLLKAPSAAHPMPVGACASTNSKGGHVGRLALDCSASLTPGH
jgi:hypothetical protein